MAMLDIREYLEEDGTSPFADWFTALVAIAAGKITVVLARIEQGNLSNVKGVGEGAGVPAGFRAGRPGGLRPRLRRSGQPVGRRYEEAAARDIEAAHARWAAYKRRKRSAT